MIFGLILALGCAVVTNAGFLLRHRGAVAAPPVDGRHPVRSARGLFGSRWWTIGWVAAVTAWLLHVGALSLVALSIVQAVISGGLVFLAVLAERCFGFRLGRRQWVGLTVTAAGLVTLGVTGGRSGSAARLSEPALIAVEATIFGIAALLVLASARVDRLRHAEGMMLAVAAGALFAFCDVSIKFLTQVAQGGVLAVLISPWTAAGLVASVVAFYTSARSLQIGPALAVIAFTSMTANVVAIVGGILIFHDSVGAGAPGIAGRMLAFCLVIAGAALMPGPARVVPADRPLPPAHAVA